MSMLPARHKVESTACPVLMIAVGSACCVRPDFVTLSFYKMFGFPTGLGALLVHRRSVDLLRKASEVTTSRQMR